MYNIQQNFEECPRYYQQSEYLRIRISAGEQAVSMNENGEPLIEDKSRSEICWLCSMKVGDSFHIYVDIVE